MGIDGGEQRRIATVSVNPRPSLSADSKWIYYTDPGGRNFRIGLGGGDPVPVEVSAPAGAVASPPPHRFHDPVPSPDGTMIGGHYYDREQRAERIAVVPLDGSPPKLFPNVPIPAYWSGDGKSLLYLVTRAGATNLWRQPIGGGPALQITRFSDQTMFNGALSPDQKRWAIVRGTISSDVVLVSERQ